MTNNSLPSQLYLLAPWDLPVEEQLSESNRSKISQLLKNLLQALDEVSHQKALAIIDRELANIDINSISPALVSSFSTKAQVKPWEVEDFNDCFNMNYVTAKDKPTCIVWGLLIVCKTLLTLHEDHRQFDPDFFKNVREGLKSHIYLLGRVFSLSLEEI